MFLLALISCTEEKEFIDQGYSIEIVDSVQFIFNAQTIPPSTALGQFQYLLEENRIAYLNQRNWRTHLSNNYSNYERSIQFFDLETGQISLTVPLKYSGRNRVINDVQNFYASSSDSIWVYPGQFDKDFGMNMPIALFNKKGEVEVRTPIRKDYMPIPKLTGAGAITQRGSELIFSSWIAWKKNRMRAPFTKLNMRNGVVDFVKYRRIPYSDLSVYLKEQTRAKEGTHWSDYLDLAEVSSVVNVNQELVSSFPLKHELSVLGLDGKVVRKRLKSLFIDEFPILAAKIKDRKELRVTARGTRRYMSLLYDSDYQVYYRIARMDVADITPLYTPTLIPAYTYSVMIIDKDFNLLAEQQFESIDYLFEKGVFAARGGLYVLRNDTLPDRMTFDKLSLTKPK